MATYHVDCGFCGKSWAWASQYSNGTSAEALRRQAEANLARHMALAKNHSYPEEPARECPTCDRRHYSTKYLRCRKCRKGPGG